MTKAPPSLLGPVPVPAQRASLFPANGCDMVLRPDLKVAPICGMT